MGIFDNLKSIGKILQEAGKIEQYKQIIEAQKELLEMQKKITELEGEIEKLKAKLKIKENLIYENNVYWIKIDEKNKDGPFCSRCWDKDKNLIRMHSRSNPAYFYCPECKKVVQIGLDYQSPYHSRRPQNYI